MSTAGRYRRFLAGPLSDEARQRLRINAKLRRYLREPALSERHHAGYPIRLIAALTGPPQAADRILWEWLYCYASADVLRRLLRNGAGTLLPDVDVRLRDPQALDHLLPQERFTPDVQVYIRSDGPRTLVCFTGNGLKLNLPVQLFHLVACEWFDRVIYLRDAERQHFTNGIAGLASGFDALVDLVGSHLAPRAVVSVLAASSGGHAAMRYAQKVQAQRVALFSPPMIFRDRSSIDDRNPLDPDRLRLYFADACPIDKKFIAPWKKTQYRRSFQMISTKTHATLSHLLTHGGIDEMFAWLSQTNRHTMERRTG